MPTPSSLTVTERKRHVSNSEHAARRIVLALAGLNPHKPAPIQLHKSDAVFVTSNGFKYVVLGSRVCAHVPSPDDNPEVPTHCVCVRCASPRHYRAR